MITSEVERMGGTGLDEEVSDYFKEPDPVLAFPLYF